MLMWGLVVLVAVIVAVIDSWLIMREWDRNEFDGNYWSFLKQRRIMVRRVLRFTLVAVAFFSPLYYEFPPEEGQLGTFDKDGNIVYHSFGLFERPGGPAPFIVDSNADYDREESVPVRNPDGSIGSLVYAVGARLVEPKTFFSDKANLEDSAASVWHFVRGMTFRFHAERGGAILAESRYDFSKKEGLDAFCEAVKSHYRTSFAFRGLEPECSAAFYGRR